MKDIANTVDKIDRKFAAAAEKNEAEMQFYGITLEQFKKDCEYDRMVYCLVHLVVVVVVIFDLVRLIT